MKKIFLLLIVVIAFILRFYRLGDLPALNADEAAIGYNAYSLIQTGKDEHGNSWPVHFQSFNDYKPGGYVYMALPFVKFLGLNELGVRIPGAFLGVLTVLVVYFLVKELLKDEKTAYLSSLFLAISPWHIHFSRGGWEVNVATFFITLGTLFFIKALRNSKLYIASFLVFALALYTYHSARITIPLLGLGLIVIYRKEVSSNLKGFLIAIIVAAICLIPLVRDLVGPAGVSRAAGVGLFADQGPLNRVNEQRGEHDDFEGIPSKLMHNKPVNYALAFAQNWVDHYHGEFLFLSGDDIQRNKVPETGQMYVIDFLFIIIGLISLPFLKSKPQGVRLILWWLVIAPVAAALTFQSPHALRAENMVIPLVVISAIGARQILAWSGRKRVLGRISVVGFIILLSIFLARYLHMYYVHMAKEYPFSSQYGVEELVSYLTSGISDKYKKVVVTDRYDQPYILFLFYLKYDPAKFQTDHSLTSRDQYGFSTVRTFDKYVFISIHDWDSLRTEYRDSLVVGTDEEIFEGTNVVKEIHGANGYKYFQVIAN
jgi:4-amino-4-deoxy-L-arabinose transferase-like glycosyltransferase